MNTDPNDHLTVIDIDANTILVKGILVIDLPDVGCTYAVRLPKSDKSMAEIKRDSVIELQRQINLHMARLNR